MKRRGRVAILQTMRSKISVEENTIIDNLIKNLKLYGFETELISLPFHTHTQRALYNSMLLWKLIDLQESDGTKIDLIISTSFPNFGLEHSNKVCWLLGCSPIMNNVESKKEKIYDEETLRRMRNYGYVALKNCNRVYARTDKICSLVKTQSDIPCVPLYHPPRLEGQYFCDTYDDYILVDICNCIETDVRFIIRATAKFDLHINVKIICEKKHDEIYAAEIQNCGVSDRIFFYADVSDEEILCLYSKAYAVITFEDYNRYPESMLEAFMSQKPVISVGAIEDMPSFFEADYNGFFCERDGEKFVECVNLLFHDKQKCKRMGTEGYQKVKSISWDVVINSLTNLNY